MKITSFKLFRLPPRWLFLAIYTDEGITGWGEPVLEGRAESVAATVEELGQYFLGKDPGKINDLWQVMHKSGFYRGGPVLMSALAGIDQALWDIKGKTLGVPVYELLGGQCRKKIKTYSWVGGDRPTDEISAISAGLQKGRSIFKLNGTGPLQLIDSHREIDKIVQRIGLIRSEFGDQIDFGIDFHGRVSVSMAAVLLKELEFAKPLFVEEPVLPEYSDCLGRLSMQTSITLAAGERLFSRTDFRSILEQRGVGIIQPDPSHAGGISECYRIAVMAEAYNVAFAPHCPLGPIALASCLTLDAVAPNFVFQEFPINIHYNSTGGLLDYIVNKNDFVDNDGYLKPLPGPGLGVEMDMGSIEANAVDRADWVPPIWRHEDGSFAEW